MKKIWLMCRYTYARRVRSSSFLVLTLVVPALMVIVGVIAYMQEAPADTLPPVGLVDRAGVLGPVDTATLPTDGAEQLARLTVVPYDDLSAAQMARAAGDIAGYVLVPDDYPNGRPIAYYGTDAPPAGMEEALAAYLRRALLPDAEPWVWARLDNPSNIVYQTLDRRLSVSEGPALLVRVVFPIGLAIVIAFLIFTGANQMGPVVVQEKEKRALEMVITSLTPTQLVTGKVLGMTLLSLTQVGVWLVGGAVALVLASSGTFSLSDLSIPWRALGWGLVLGIPGYFLFAVLASGLGIIAGSSRQAQQFAGILGLFAVAPLWFAGILVAAPDGAAAVALSIFPLTAPIMALFRMALVEVPTWQLALAFLLTVVSLVAAIWAVARIFRSDMLLYGQTLHPRQVWQALREA